MSVNFFAVNVYPHFTGIDFGRNSELGKALEGETPKGE